MSTRDITRRTFLRGLGGTTIALPLVSAGPLGARAGTASGKNESRDGYPKRFIVFFHPNGVIPEAWWPDRQSETEFTLNQSLQPLQSFKDRLVFMEGVHMKSPGAGPGGPHQQGMGGVLTGRPLQEGQMVGNDGSLAGWGDGISIDQAIANEIGESTPFESLHLGVRGDAHGGSRVRTRISYAGSAQPVPPQNNPRDVFEQLFSDFRTNSEAHETIRDQRASVLDTVQSQFERIEDRVSASDRAKLQRHLQRVRDLERRLQQGVGSKEACQQPDPPADRNPNSEDTMPEIMQAQLDLAVMALACDLTRVATIQVSNSVNHIRYPWIDSTGDGHALSHAGPSNTEAHREWKRRDRWHAKQFAYLLEELDSIPEGDGTMLDNTVLLWVMEIAKGNTHSHQDMPFVLAGNVADQFETGRHLQYSGQSHNDLLAAIARAYGVELPHDTFGDRRFGNGPIADLT